MDSNFSAKGPRHREFEVVRLSVDEPTTTTREQIKQLLALVLELLAQDVSAPADSPPRLPAEHVGDVELTVAEHRNNTDPTIAQPDLVDLSNKHTRKSIVATSSGLRR